MIDIILAVVLDFIIGDPYWFPHPVIYIGKLISILEKKARTLAKHEKTLRVYGGVIVIIVAGLSFLIPYSLLRLAKPFPLIYHIINILIIWTTISARCLHKEAAKIYEALKNNDIEEARKKLSYIVGRDTMSLNVSEIIRADVETVAENTSDGVIAPLLFAMIGGAPLAMLYKGINTMDSMLGYMNDKYKFIGYFPAKTDDLFNLIPARISGVLISLAAPIAHGNIYKSLKIMFRDRKNHKSPNCAYPEAAAAGAMKVQLGGTNSYFGDLVYKPTIGDKIRDLKSINIMDSIKLMYGAELILICIYLFFLSFK
ncbi:adenosylcobinamide-phosphate synthase CbiB [Candidatus Clostridium stratigraminis]|uniref:Cobalamin biosynthesis protein CobD n=1 Tax=Candidatus Clostridium stratigraminis TaxID=3381661 RepID=A0ABW8T1E1_9CLOT